MFDECVWEVLAAFESAKTEQDYNNAKQLCCKRFEPLAQMAFIDAAREARSRCLGVL